MPSFSLDREIPILNSVTPSIVYDKLRNLKSDKSPGPEGWPVLALKEIAKELCLPLYILFTKSLQSSSVPEIWKQVFVTPIHKKGERCKAENYISKCFILHLGPDHSYGDYYLDGVQILSNTTVKRPGCYYGLLLKIS